MVSMEPFGISSFVATYQHPTKRHSDEPIMLVSLIPYTILRIDADGGELNFSTTFIADGLGIYACIYYIPPSFSRTSSNQSPMSSTIENGSPQPKNQIHITASGDAKDKHVTKNDIAEDMTIPCCCSDKHVTKDDLPKGMTIPCNYSDCRRKQLQMRLWDIQRLLLGNLLSRL
jgi:hypothetical protein